MAVPAHQQAAGRTREGIETVSLLLSALVERCSLRSLIRLAAIALIAAAWGFVYAPNRARAADADELTTPTFSAIYRQILAPAGCGASFCHGADSPAAALTLRSRDEAYESLVKVPAGGTACVDSKLVRVAPGNPEASLLLMKLDGRAPCGVPMPAPDAPLTGAEIDMIRRWIESGAPND